MGMRILIIFLLFGWSVSQAQGPVQKIRITELQDYISKSDHPLIVNFWATFCVPCNKEIPYFQSTVARYKDQGVELILVSLDLPDYFPGKISDFVRKQGYTSKILWLNETDADYVLAVCG
jgi:thiol-disulfide isomerase/thioredoxin